MDIAAALRFGQLTVFDAFAALAKLTIDGMADRAAMHVVVMPAIEAARRLDPTRRADFPRPLQRRFRGRRFIPLDPPDFVDHEGTEVVSVGAKRGAPAAAAGRRDPE